MLQITGLWDPEPIVSSLPFLQPPRTPWDTQNCSQVPSFTLTEECVVFLWDHKAVNLRDPGTLFSMCFPLCLTIKKPSLADKSIPQGLFLFPYASNRELVFWNIFVAGAQPRIPNVHHFQSHIKIWGQMPFLHLHPGPFIPPQKLGGQLLHSCSSDWRRNYLPSSIATGTLWATRGRGMTGHSLHPCWWRNLPGCKSSCYYKCQSTRRDHRNRCLGY